MTSVRIIANPHAAGGRAERILPSLVERLDREGIAHTLARTEGPGHARKLARDARLGGDGPILVVGGDGTVHEVAGGLVSEDTGPGGPAEGRTPPPLAVLPVGTGNDFFRMLRSPRKVDGIPRLLREGVPRPFEVGIARWQNGSSPFVNLVGIGIDVEVLRRRASFQALSGLPQYLAGLASALVRFRPTPVSVRFANGAGRMTEFTAPVLLSAVTVGPSVGGGFLLSPRARPDDGLLDLFVAERMGILRILRLLPSILRGTLGSTRGVHVEQVSRVEIRPAEGTTIPFEMDGELMRDEVEFLEIEVRSGGLSVLELPEDG